MPACAEAGILGALPGMLGSMMALEVIREIVGFGEGLVGRLLMVDARAMRFETLSYAWDPQQSAIAARRRRFAILSIAQHKRRHLVQFATAAAPFITDHLLSPVADER